jgi:hypothetical protein
VDIAHFQLSVDFSLGFAFSVHGAALFFSAFSLFPLLFCAPVAHWDAYGRGNQYEGFASLPWPGPHKSGAGSHHFLSRILCFTEP